MATDWSLVQSQSSLRTESHSSLTFRKALNYQLISSSKVLWKSNISVLLLCWKPPEAYLLPAGWLLAAAGKQTAPAKASWITSFTSVPCLTSTTHSYILHCLKNFERWFKKKPTTNKKPQNPQPPLTFKSCTVFLNCRRSKMQKIGNLKQTH